MPNLIFYTKTIETPICKCGSIFIRHICYNCGNVNDSGQNHLLIPVLLIESTTPKKKSKSFTAVQKKRFRIFTRDGWKCLKCGFQVGDLPAKNKNNRLTIDHVIPKSKGGVNADVNLQTLCRKCNGEKGANTVDYRENSSE